MSGINIEKDFPNVYKWWSRINERPAVQAGLSVPSGAPSPFGIPGLKKKLQEDEEAKKTEQELQEALAKAKEQYGYVYKSP